MCVCVCEVMGVLQQPVHAIIGLRNESASAAPVVNDYSVCGEHPALVLTGGTTIQTSCSNALPLARHVVIQLNSNAHLAICDVNVTAKGSLFFLSRLAAWLSGYNVGL